MSSQSGKGRHHQAHHNNNGRKKLHPCLRWYGSCDYGGTCRFKDYPFDVCIHFLNGKCTPGKNCPKGGIHITPPPGGAQAAAAAEGTAQPARANASVAAAHPTARATPSGPTRADRLLSEVKRLNGTLGDCHPCVRVFPQGCESLARQGRCYYAPFPSHMCLRYLKILFEDKKPGHNPNATTCGHPRCSDCHDLPSALARRGTAKSTNGTPPSPQKGSQRSPQAPLPSAMVPNRAVTVGDFSPEFKISKGMSFAAVVRAADDSATTADLPGTHQLPPPAHAGRGAPRNEDDNDDGAETAGATTDGMSYDDALRRFPLDALSDQQPTSVSSLAVPYPSMDELLDPRDSLAWVLPKIVAQPLHQTAQAAHLAALLLNSREDLVGSLRRAMALVQQEHRATQQSKRPFSWENVKKNDGNHDVRYYDNVRFTGGTFSSAVGIAFKLEVDLSRYHRRIRWDRRLLQGSLLLISFSNFQDLGVTLFATVVKAHTDAEVTQNGRMRNTFNGRVDVELINVPSKVLVKLLDYHQDVSVLESPIFYLPYAETYKNNRKLMGEELKATSDQRPALEWQILGGQLLEKKSKGLGPPSFFRNVELDLSDVVATNPESGPFLYKPDRPSSWDASIVTPFHPDVENGLEAKNRDEETFLHALDDTQCDALRHMLGSPIPLVQGPPGTGKTFIGVKYLQVVHRNRKVLRDNGLNRPILLICETNHAVDALLGEVYRMMGHVEFVSNVVRVGQGSKRGGVDPPLWMDRILLRRKVGTDLFLPTGHAVLLRRSAELQDYMDEVIRFILRGYEKVDKAACRDCFGPQTRDKRQQRGANNGGGRGDDDTDADNDNVWALGLRWVSEMQRGRKHDELVRQPCDEISRLLQLFRDEANRHHQDAVQRFHATENELTHWEHKLRAHTARVHQLTHLSMDELRTVWKELIDGGESAPQRAEASVTAMERTLRSTCSAYGNLLSSPPLLMRRVEAELNDDSNPLPPNVPWGRVLRQASRLQSALEKAKAMADRLQCIASSKGDDQEHYFLIQYFIEDLLKLQEEVQDALQESRRLAPVEAARSDVQELWRVQEQTLDCKKRLEVERQCSATKSPNLSYLVSQMENARPSGTAPMVVTDESSSEDAEGNDSTGQAPTAFDDEEFDQQERDAQNQNRDIGEFDEKDLVARLNGQTLVQTPASFRIPHKLKTLLSLLQRTSELLTEKISEDTSHAKFLKSLELVDALQSSFLVAGTVAGISRLADVWRLLKPQVVLVEEAAEVREESIWGCLTPSVKQLVQIGDDMQLRPKINEQPLRRLNFGTSLMERLIRSVGHAHATITTQRRMHPSLSALIKPYYARAGITVIDHTITALRSPAAPPLGQGEDRLWMIDPHGVATCDPAGTSYLNDAEAKCAVHLAKYFLEKNGSPISITILCTYAAQQTLLVETARLKGLNFWEKVRISTVDNYQGEEADIVILSLVRTPSRSEATTADPLVHMRQDVGFLAAENRLCVALSRARRHMVILGSRNILTYRTKTAHLLSDLRSETHLAQQRRSRTIVWSEGAVSITCPHHTKPLEISWAIEKDPRPPVCTTICEKSLMPKCAHTCRSKCHTHHACPPCNKSCERIMSCGHRCRKTCGEPCDANTCAEQIEVRCKTCNRKYYAKCHLSSTAPCTHPCQTTLSCGHKCQTKCGSTLHRHDAPDCPVKTPKNLPCKHTVEVPCGMPVEDVRCPEPCGAKLSCGHACKHSCSACKDRRGEHPPCRETVTVVLPCTHRMDVLCGNPLAICGKSCIPCGGGHPCGLCPAGALPPVPDLRAEFLQTAAPCQNRPYKTCVHRCCGLRNLKCPPVCPLCSRASTTSPKKETAVVNNFCCVVAKGDEEKALRRLLLPPAEEGEEDDARRNDTTAVDERGTSLDDELLLERLIVTPCCQQLYFAGDVLVFFQQAADPSQMVTLPNCFYCGKIITEKFPFASSLIHFVNATIRFVAHHARALGEEQKVLPEIVGKLLRRVYHMNADSLTQQLEHLTPPQRGRKSSENRDLNLRTGSFAQAILMQQGIVEVPEYFSHVVAAVWLFCDELKGKLGKAAGVASLVRTLLCIFRQCGSDGISKFCTVVSSRQFAVLHKPPQTGRAGVSAEAATSDAPKQHPQFYHVLTFLRNAEACSALRQIAEAIYEIHTIKDYVERTCYQSDNETPRLLERGWLPSDELVELIRERVTKELPHMVPGFGTPKFVLNPCFVTGCSSCQRFVRSLPWGRGELDDALRGAFVDDSASHVLFHGTKQTAIAKIACRGFDVSRRGANGQAHGPGEYFSRDFGLSLQYSQQDSNRNRDAVMVCIALSRFASIPLREVRVPSIVVINNQPDCAAVVPVGVVEQQSFGAHGSGSSRPLDVVFECDSALLGSVRQDFLDLELDIAAALQSGDAVATQAKIQTFLSSHPDVAAAISVRSRSGKRDANDGTDAAASSQEENVFLSTRGFDKETQAWRICCPDAVNDDCSMVVHLYCTPRCPFCRFAFPPLS